MNDDGTINENGGKYAGMDRYEARKVMEKNWRNRDFWLKWFHILIM